MNEMREFIEARSVPVPESGCWLWLGSTNGTGYGDFRKGGHFLAHRSSYEAFVAPIPIGLHVLHKCDVPACVNPNHLFPGTNAQNIADSVRKGRRKGVRRNRPLGLKYRPKTLEQRAKVMRIPPEERGRVRELVAAGMSQKSVAAHYRVDPSTISKLLSTPLA